MALIRDVGKWASPEAEAAHDYCLALIGDSLDEVGEVLAAHGDRPGAGELFNREIERHLARTADVTAYAMELRDRFYRPAFLVEGPCES